ncbi:hypothetical protein [Klebsiella variicola]|nr:hypothetical protein [Klebsiella variicola]HBZ8007025.1 hypothetical protein [Klebsiella variicola subsp. variicola]ELN4040751.1 hypothetical protein [Klebsiella variicola]HCB0896886.1 hypothetical protein [Klebsiella variicola subsp. variicola]HCB0914134.1 hypothetical protein [Klebsiella variicola subsp. variicola]HCB4012057.1 hypothetical protein [Klebsiella variicola subsp. variicola]
MVVKRVNKQSIAIKKHHPGNRTALFIITQTEN